MATESAEVNEQRRRLGRRRGAPERAQSVQLAEKGGWVRRMLPFLKAHRLDLIFVFSAAVGSQVITGLIPFLLADVVDNAILDDTQPLIPFLVLILGLALVRYVLAFARRYYGGRLGIAVEYDLRNAVYDHLQRLDFARHEVFVDGKQVKLTASEFKVLTLLAREPERVFSRRQVMEHLWESSYVGDEHAADVHISNLRRKIERDSGHPERIVTVRSFGYKLVPA
jgi:ABC-type multidrug transport system fused ATPase/permease subunit